MTQVMSAAAEASSLTQTDYDADRQYAAPFACETAMPGNYFKYDDLTTPVRQASYSGSVAKTGRAIAEIAEYELRTTDSVNHDDLTDRMVHGTHEMVWRRWGVGGFAEGLVGARVGMLSDERAEKIVEDKFGCTLAAADRKHGVDIVDPSGSTHQVKAKDEDHKPSPSDKKDADHLWWFNTETGKLTKME